MIRPLSIFFVLFGFWGVEAFSQTKTQAYPGQGTLWSPGIGRISKYDHVIRLISDDWGYDWRFISAIAMAESQFNPTARSHRGATGLMQIMPITARQFKVGVQNIEDPFVNISLAVELLDHINRTLRFPAWVSERDRLSIVLAAYNAGMTHVLDARRLAVKYGENYNSWPVVAKYLELKTRPEYFEDEVVRAGRFSGSAETLAYVDKVMRYYEKYLEQAPF